MSLDRFLLGALKCGKRLDGRGFNQFRDLSIEFGSEYGLVDITLGKTRILVKVSAEVTRPFEDRPYEGLFIITIEQNQSTDQEVVISRLIEKAVRRSNALDVESLCIVAGEKCWAIRADVHIMNDDGGIVDAACIGVMSALCHFKRPQVTIQDGGHAVIHSVESQTPEPLSILHIPICVTFSFFSNDTCLVDTTSAEEFQTLSTLIITINNNNDICQISASGSKSMDPLKIVECSELALQHAKTITNLIQQSVKQDLDKKDNQMLLSAENER